MARRRILDEIQHVPKTIERGAVFKGTLQGDENYLVHGEVYGDSDLSGVLMIGNECRWKGDINADVVIVKGIVLGNIMARTKIELRNGAKVSGDVNAPMVAIAHGAYVRGVVHEDCIVNHFHEQRTH